MTDADLSAIMRVSCCVLLCLFVSCTNSEDVLRSHFPVLGLTEVAARNFLKPKNSCVGQLKNLYNAVRKRESWALKIVDASGAPKTGFIWGNNYWLGSQTQCRRLGEKHPTASGKTAAEFPPFRVGFYVATLQLKSDKEVQDSILLGLCLPVSCTEVDLEPVIKTWASQNSLAVQTLFNFTMSFDSVRSIESGTWIASPPAVTLIVMMSAILLLVITGTYFDVSVTNPERQLERGEDTESDKKDNTWSVARNIQESAELLNHDNNLNNCYELKIDNSMHKSIPTSTSKTQPAVMDRMPEDRRSFLKKFIACFSLTSNTNIILDLSESDKAASIYGLRTLGTCWIILLHSLYYFQHYSDDKPSTVLTPGLDVQLINISTFSIDTLFFLNGFLLAYVYYKKLRVSLKADDNFSVKKKVNEFSSMVVKRYLRLTPVYLVVLGLSNINITRSKRTSLFPPNEKDGLCERYWWRNVLYINNLFRSDEMCMSWSWYLSTDMQFFMLGTAILILSKRFWRSTVAVVGSLMTISSLLTGYLAYDSHFTPKFSTQTANLDILYYPPWARIGPHLVGMVTGYMVVHLNGRLELKRTTLMTCWTVGLLCSLWALFGLYQRNVSLIAAALYTALSRTAWAIGLLWIVVACCTNNGGVINKFLSFSGWAPISKLYYSAYLLSPLLIDIIYSSAESAMNLDSFSMIAQFVGQLGIVLFCSYFFALFFETPFKQLTRWGIGYEHTANILSPRQS